MRDAAEAAEAVLSYPEQPLWVLTAAAGEQRGGLVATFVVPVSIVARMPRLLVGLSVRHHTTDLVRRSSAFALHPLTEADLAWVWNFGLSSGRVRDKLRGLDLRRGATGAPILVAAAGFLECRVESSMEIGDRTVFLGAVVDAAAPPHLARLTMSRLREIAPTDQLARMDELYRRDAEIDAQLIAEFRS